MLHFIINPTAGNGRARQFRAAIEQRLDALKIEKRFHETREKGHAAALARELCASGIDEIIAMGGDGTLNEVLNGLTDPAKVRLGLVPCGGGNDFAAAAGIPVEPMQALELILNGQAKPTDYMECSGVRGINIIGAGIDVDILRAYAKLGLTGSLGYLLALIKTLLHFDFYEFTEHRSDADVPHSAFIACAGNGRRYGGGITVCPEAVIDDGLLDIVIIDNLRKRAIPRAFMKLMKKEILSLPETVFRRGDRLTISSDKPLPIQIDGEIYEDLPFDVCLVPDGLMMFRP